jgi:hypothetical protein
MSKQAIAAGAVSAILVALAVVGIVHWNKPPVAAPAAIPGQSVAPATRRAPDPLQDRLDGIFGRYRKTIILLEDDDALPEVDRETASVVGRVRCSPISPTRLRV